MSENTEMADRFVNIYGNNLWTPTDPSQVHLEDIWTATVQEVLRWKKIASVLEVGCGRAHASARVRWGKVKYLGVDIVPSCIEEAKKRPDAATKGMQFAVLDAAVDDLPSADLLLMKSVLQHWHNEEIWWFLSRLKQFPWLLICDDVCHRNWNLWYQGKPTTLNGGNMGVAEKPWRPLSLIDHPFNLPGTLLALYRTSYEGYKGIFLIRGQGEVTETTEAASSVAAPVVGQSPG
jgi:SAM-dependent methyltransferase